MKTEKETWKLFLMRAAILLVMMLTMTVQTAWADAGATTTHFTWAYVESTQTLTITRGSTDGEMGNVPTNASRPWESYKNSIQHLVIGAGVTHIGQRDFQSHTALQDVTFEEGCTLEAIRDYAFDGCTSLTSITLPEGLTTITSYAFYKTGLTSVTIPSTMTRIYPHAFENCTSLTSVTMNVVDPATLTLSDDSFQSGVTVYVMYNVDAWNTKFPSTYHCNFTEMASDTWESGDTDVKLYANGTMFVSKKAGDGDGAMANSQPWSARLNDIKTAIVKDGVTAIGNYAFADCTSLSSVTLPDGLTSIGVAAFKNTGLTSVTIPSSVTSLGIVAFDNCTALASVTIFASSLTTYGLGAFDGNAADRKIFVASSSLSTYQTGWNDYATAIEPLDYIIDEGNDVSILSNGSGKNVALKRSFPAGKKQTVCLPYAPEELLQYGKVWEFTGIASGKVVMTERTSGLQANKPYIFEGTNDLTNITFPSVDVSIGSDPKTADGTAGFTFHGTYEKKHWLATDEAVVNGTIYGFMAQDNDGQATGQFVSARRETYLRPFSCYLEYNGVLNGTQNAARRTTRGEFDTGVYINNGRKVVIK